VRGEPIGSVGIEGTQGAGGKGLYASNGAAHGFVGYSDPRWPEPDIFSMAYYRLASREYFRQFSTCLATRSDGLTWRC